MHAILLSYSLAITYALLILALMTLIINDKLRLALASFLALIPFAWFITNLASLQVCLIAFRMLTEYISTGIKPAFNSEVRLITARCT